MVSPEFLHMVSPEFLQDKMEFLLGTMKTDDNLQVVNYAGCLFLDESKQNDVKPLEIEKMINWWEQNKNEYQE